MGRKLSGKYLWGITVGCFLYGVGFLFIFTKADSLWCKTVAGFLGVSAITLLPMIYGFCRERLHGAGETERALAADQLLFSFGMVGGFTVFSLPLCCLWAGAAQAVLLSYTLLIMFLFHGVLWYAFFVRLEKR